MKIRRLLLLPPALTGIRGETALMAGGFLLMGYQLTGYFLSA